MREIQLTNGDDNFSKVLTVVDRKGSRNDKCIEKWILFHCSNSYRRERDIVTNNSLERQINREDSLKTFRIPPLELKVLLLTRHQLLRSLSQELQGPHELQWTHPLPFLHSRTSEQKLFWHTSNQTCDLKSNIIWAQEEKVFWYSDTICEGVNFPKRKSIPIRANTSAIAVVLLNMQTARLTLAKSPPGM